MTKRPVSNLIISSAVFLFILLGIAKSANAALSLESFVSIRPANMSDLSLTEFTDTLDTTGSIYLGEDPIIFKVTLKNTSDTTLTGVKLEDIPPDYLVPHGIGLPGWDPAARVVRIDAGDIRPNQSNDYLVPMKLVDNSVFPAEPRIFCVTNRIRAAAGSETASDSSQFCIEKKPPGNVSLAPTSAPRATATPTAQQQPSATPTPTSGPKNVTTVPNTGSQAGILVAGLELITLGAGVVIKRRYS